MKKFDCLFKKGLCIRILLFGIVVCNVDANSENYGSDIRLDGLGIRLIKMSPGQNGFEGKDFYIQDTEVTNAQFQIYLDETEEEKGDTISSIASGDGLKYLLWKGNDFPEERADHPVVLVSPSECEGFCRWLTSRTPLLRGQFRLPTKKEWIFSAYGKSRKYPWGNEFREDAFLFNATQGSAIGPKLRHPRTTNAVKRYDKGMTPEGLYGMWGNVNELVSVLGVGESGWAARAYWLGGSFMTDKIFRPRQEYWGYAHDLDYQSFDIGFRIVFIQGVRKGVR